MDAFPLFYLKICTQLVLNIYSTDPVKELLRPCKIKNVYKRNNRPVNRNQGKSVK